MHEKMLLEAVQPGWIVVIDTSHWLKTYAMSTSKNLSAISYQMLALKSGEITLIPSCEVIVISESISEYIKKQAETLFIRPEDCAHSDTCMHFVEKLR